MMFDRTKDRNWVTGKNAGKWNGCRTPAEARQKGTKLWAKVPHELLDLLHGDWLSPHHKAVVVTLIDQLYRFGNGKDDRRNYLLASRRQLAAGAGVGLTKLWEVLIDLADKRVITLEEVNRGRYRIGFYSAEMLKSPW